MERFRNCIRCSKKSLLRIPFVDKCLILFMFILLTQSAISLFHGGAASKDANDIDLIIRTSSAAIFGYFISGNFIRHSSTNRDSQNADLTISEIPNQPAEDYATHKLQIIIATSIGIFCLITLLIERDLRWADNLSSSSPSANVIIAQFRDFVSGCVGFLIGTPTHRSS